MLIFGVAVVVSGVVAGRSVRLFHVVLGAGPGGRVVRGQVVAGGGCVEVNSSSHSAAQGQAVGRCSRNRRPERATRAGTVIDCLRMVAPVARACDGEARVPAVRVKLNAIAASTSHAALAVNFPDGGARAHRTSGRR